MMLPRTGESVLSAGSPRKVDGPRFANQHDLDLSRILQLGLYTPCDLLRHRCHANVIDVVRHDDDAYLAPCLDRIDLVHPLVARRNALEPLESLDVRLE